MSEVLKGLEVVALTEDMPEVGLVRGQVGTLVEPLSDCVWEVEFSGDNGQAYAVTPVKDSRLMVLHHAPVKTV